MRDGTRGLAVAMLATVCALGLVASPAGAGSATSRDAFARVDAPAEALVRSRPLAVPGGGAIDRYRQRIGGLPVIGAQATVARPVGAAPYIVVDHTVSGLEVPPAPRLSRRAAVDAAKAAGGVERLRALTRARLGADPRSGRAVWEVRLAAAEPLADLAVLIDARNGAALRARDLLRHATGIANVFNPNPVVTQGSYAGLRDANDKDSPLLTRLRRPVTLERLTGTAGCLRGAHVDIRLGFGKKAKRVCSPGFDFGGVTRAAGAFEAVMAYYHIDRTRAYVDSLELSKGLRAQPQRVDVNSFSEDNSYFSPFDRRLAFGTGGVDDAEDADVIIHEYGHSIQDQQARFFGETLEGGSMGEGFADYLAAVMSVPLTGGIPSFDACMFEWDAVSYTDNACGRHADSGLTKQKGLRSCFEDPHCVGRAWSGALWDLRGILGTDTGGLSVADRVIIESHFLLDRNSDFRDGARALIAADKLLYAGAHIGPIKAEMAQRGFCRKTGC